MHYTDRSENGWRIWEFPSGTDIKVQLNDAEKKSVVELLMTFMKGRKNQSNHLTVEQ
jgi:hypothetical protein